ncbi:unnamed protein product [Orchesella dallaii]|uniref:Uncharacterized protein n=1 Tax=Orchesella dallaii TaxID=48710 RepID=A0ABP1S157_9HEXA
MILNKGVGSTDPLGGYLNYNLDTDSIIIQVPNVGATTYHLVSDPNGYPVFTRPISDRGKKFITFSNPLYPPGSGQYVIFRKMSGQSYSGMNIATQGNSLASSRGLASGQIFYETFQLNFKDSLHGSVSDLDPTMYGFMHIDVGTNNGRNKIGMKITRLKDQAFYMKRKR